MWLRLKPLAMLAMYGVIAGCGGSSGGGGGSNFYTIGVTVSGLTAGTLVLQNNGTNNLSLTSNSSFTFNTRLVNGSTYNVTVLSHPVDQFCTVSNGSGTVSSANVVNVAVSCMASCVLGTGSAINVSGNITFDHVPHTINGGLDYTGTLPYPVRGAVVEAMCFFRLFFNFG